MTFILKYVSLWLFILIQPSYTVLSVQTFQINLDLPPEERWKEVILAKRRFIQTYTKKFLETLVFKKLSLFLSDFYGRTYFKGTEFAREITGVAHYSKLSFSQIFLMNYMYESLAGCTSILFENEAGEIVLGHNLDYYWTDSIGNSIVLLEFYRNNQLLYKAHSVAGQIGIFTGIKSNKYAMTLNQRATGIYNLIFHYKQLLMIGLLPVIYNIRLSLENSTNFYKVVKFLSEVQLASPCYFTVSGVKHNEGIIITRNANSVANLTWLNSNIDKNEWFLVQTNSDRDMKDYEIIDIRRFVAENRMRRIGKKLMNSKKLVEDVLSLFPNKNFFTILSSFAIPQKGEINATIWV